MLLHPIKFSDESKTHKTDTIAWSDELIFYPIMLSYQFYWNLAYVQYLRLRLFPCSLHTLNLAVRATFTLNLHFSSRVLSTQIFYCILLIFLWHICAVLVSIHKYNLTFSSISDTHFHFKMQLGHYICRWHQWDNHCHTAISALW